MKPAAIPPVSLALIWTSFHYLGERVETSEKGAQMPTKSELQGCRFSTWGNCRLDSLIFSVVWYSQENATEPELPLLMGCAVCVLCTFGSFLLFPTVKVIKCMHFFMGQTLNFQTRSSKQWVVNVLLYIRQETAAELFRAGSLHCKRDWGNSGAKQVFSQHKSRIFPALSWKSWENGVCHSINLA